MPPSSSGSSGVALVTGAARGIGAACAEALAADGWHVVVTDLDAQSASATAERIRAAGGSAESRALDVADADMVRRVVGDVATGSGLDVAVNNAGLNLARTPLADLSDDDWRRMNAVNLDGVFFCMREEIRAMRGRGGVIITVGSMLSTIGYPNAAAYIAAKHAVLGLTRSAAVDYADEGIRVNLVAPGHVRTDLGPVGMTKEREQQVASAYPLHRVADPEEVADLVAFLASPRARNITGACMVSDGGYTAR